jgi:hypothetical protein
MYRKAATDPTRVSFRLAPELAAELARKANEARTSTGRYARDLVSKALFQLDEKEQDIRMVRIELTALPRLLDLLQTLQTDLATSVAILLVNAGKLQPDQARQWVKQALLPKKSPEEN